MIIVSDIEKIISSLNLVKMEYVPFILGFNVLAIIVRTFRQKLFLDKLGLRLSFRDNIFYQFHGLSMIATPGGLGQSIKSISLKQNNNFPYSKTICVTLFERYSDLLSAVSLIGLMLLFTSSFEGVIVFASFSILLVCVFIIISKQKSFQYLIKLIPKIGPFKTIKENQHELYKSSSTLLKPKTLVLGGIIGLISWIFMAVAFYITFLAFNIEISFSQSTLITFVPGTVGSLSFIPAGLGIIEVGMLGLLLKQGLNFSTSSALILFIRLTNVWFYMFLGIIFTKIVTHKRKH